LKFKFALIFITITIFTALADFTRADFSNWSGFHFFSPQMMVGYWENFHIHCISHYLKQYLLSQHDQKKKMFQRSSWLFENLSL
jgi:hypothetical protein